MSNEKSNALRNVATEIAPIEAHIPVISISPRIEKGVVTIREPGSEENGLPYVDISTFYLDRMSMKDILGYCPPSPTRTIYITSKEYPKGELVTAENMDRIISEHPYVEKEKSHAATVGSMAAIEPRGPAVRAADKPQGFCSIA